MKNEYGAKLDRNGYAPSIIPGHDECRCYMCDKNGAYDPIDRHEIFGGGLREKSKRYGLWVHLCGFTCHRGDNGVHRNRAIDLRLKQVAQMAAMEEYGWTVDDFREIFRNNYIDEGGTT